MSSSLIEYKMYSYGGRTGNRGVVFGAGYAEEAWTPKPQTLNPHSALKTNPNHTNDNEFGFRCCVYICMYIHIHTHTHICIYICKSLNNIIYLWRSRQADRGSGGRVWCRICRESLDRPIGMPGPCGAVRR